MWFKYYNVIICIKKRGDISPLECKNESNDVNLHFEEGDAGIFNGGNHSPSSTK